MLEINFPGQKQIKLAHLVCDINGTLTLDGRILEGVPEAVTLLKSKLEVHLLSADTLGKAGVIAETLGVSLHRIEPGNEARQKAAFIKQFGADTVAAVGQGANDRLMLKQAALGICVLSREGTAVPTLMAADLVVPDILAAFELLEHPVRMIATLRE